MGRTRRSQIVSSDEESKSASGRPSKRTRTKASTSASSSKSTITASSAPARGGRARSGRPKGFLEAVVSDTSGDDEQEDEKEQSEEPAVDQKGQELASGSDSDEDVDVAQEEEVEVKDTIRRSNWFYPDIIAKDTAATKSSDMDIDQNKGYILEHLIRAHSRSTHEGQEETSTDTWACAFQPTLPVARLGTGATKPVPRKSSSIVATCGGNTVCLIDCQLGRVMAKYSHMEEEEFMCLAWTTLDHATLQDGESSKDDKDGVISEAQTTQSNILAAAGASADGTVRLWDIGSLVDDDTEACCLAKFVGLDNSAVTAIGVSEKYLIAGTENGLMAQYNIFALEKELESIKQGRASKTDGRRSQHTHLHSVQPEKLYPPSQEWHESSVDDIVYIPYFSAKSYRAIQDQQGDTNATRGGGKGRGRGRGGRGGRGKANGAGARGKRKTDDGDAEFIFASRESFQGEILVWDATKSTDTDAELKNIFEWPIAEGWTKFTVAENPRYGSTKATGTTRQNILVAGSTDGQVVLYDMGKKAKRAADGNIVAQKPTKIISHADSTELLHDVAVSEDLSMIVAGDWSNRVLSWNYRNNSRR
ncbi:Leucine-rich repeats and WD repeat domain-containing protein 1 [Podila clonocystis]|nr:Leucine-rich repeats and WD repeat domain-containing protein 1 [Podila clonocystis]